VLVILRHAEPRRSESDPELTSFGHRMALEAGQWVASLLPADVPVQVLHTATMRTRQTAENVLHCLGERARLGVVEEVPETLLELDILADRICGRRLDLPTPPLPPTVLVGHHTSLVGLARDLDLPKSRLNPRHFSAGLAMNRSRPSSEAWQIEAIWPGRPG
jgi:phosphohistidine phosphatase SixA